jgi:hypothetical protein
VQEKKSDEMNATADIALMTWIRYYHRRYLYNLIRFVAGLFFEFSDGGLFRGFSVIN